MLDKIKSIFSYSAISDKYEKYEKYISPFALFSGFILDSLTLRRADLLAENILIIAYLLVAGAGICILNIWQKRDNGTESKVHLFAFLGVQFAFGGLFSTFLVFYIRSASLTTSFLFIAFIALMFVGSEIFKKKYLVFSFQISVLFIAIFSYAIFLVPTIFHEIGATMFLLSGAISLGLIYLFLLAFFRVTSEKFIENRTVIVRNIGIVFIVINIFYFTNIIPPVPLSLEDSGVYHSLNFVAGGYRVEREAKRWTDYFRIHDLFHRKAGENVYLYSAVFSPTELDTSIVHDWQYFDNVKGRWVSHNKVAVPIVGGREGGYRLYSINKFIFPALWRVDIETLRGQVIGRVKFKVVDATGPINLVEEIK